MFGIPLIAMVVAGGVSYGTTGKGISDNVASFIIQEDCALHYVITEETFM